jgi:hypothetical protein
MKRIVEYIASVRFFILVSALLAVCAAVASVIPQGLTWAEYEEMLHPLVWTMVRAISLHEFYASPLFLILVVLMEASLLLCAVPRLVRRIAHRRGRGRVAISGFAADVIHVGLAVVIAGGFVEHSLRERWEYSGPVGGVLTVDDGAIEVMDAGEYYTERGSLAGWYIDVSVETGGSPANDSEVRFGSNDPAGTVLGRLHFRNYHRTARAVLADTSVRSAGEKELALTEGEGLIDSTGGGVILVDTIEGGAVFAELTDIPETRQEIRRAVEEAPRFLLAPGERIGSLRLVEASTSITVAFSLTRNPGRLPILVGLALMAAGMVLYLSKRLNKVD